MIVFSMVQLTCGFMYKGGKCVYFVLLINNSCQLNPPYGQSDFTINPGPMIILVQIMREVSHERGR